MRIALVSDIHSNRDAWRAVLQDIESVGVDTIVCLGDVVGYGPYPAEVLDDVYEHADHFCLGNHDAVIGGHLDPECFYDKAREVIEWTRAQLSDDAANFFHDDVPMMIAEEDVLFSHAEMEVPERFDYIFTPEESVPSFTASKESFLFVGHTHQPCTMVLQPDGTIIRREATGFTAAEGHRYLVNVGSVGDPRDGDLRASYCILNLDRRSVEFRKVPFDYIAFRTALQKAELSSQPHLFTVLAELTPEEVDAMGVLASSTETEDVYESMPITHRISAPTDFAVQSDASAGQMTKTQRLHLTAGQASELKQLAAERHFRNENPRGARKNKSNSKAKAGILVGCIMVLILIGAAVGLLTSKKPSYQTAATPTTIPSPTPTTTTTTIPPAPQVAPEPAPTPDPASLASTEPTDKPAAETNVVAATPPIPEGPDMTRRRAIQAAQTVIRLNQLPKDNTLPPPTTATGDPKPTSEQVAGLFDKNMDGRNGWRTDGIRKDVWLQLTWDQPVTIERVALFPKRHANNRTSGYIVFDNGDHVSFDKVSAKGNEGAMLTFPAISATNMRVVITSKIKPNSPTRGFTEMRLYGPPPEPTEPPPDQTQPALTGAPEPVLEWDFESDFAAKGNGLRLAPKRGSSGAEPVIASGEVTLQGGYLLSQSLPTNLRDFTLEAWVQLDNLDQRAGGVIGIQRQNGAVFDAIVFGEQTAQMWTTGSDNSKRSRPFVNAPRETASPNEIVRITMVFKSDGTRIAYRNGEPYGNPMPRKDPHVSYNKGAGRIILGIRHTPYHPSKILQGKIARARVYDTALTAEQVAAVPSLEPASIPQAGAPTATQLTSSATPATASVDSTTTPSVEPEIEIRAKANMRGLLKKHSYPVDKFDDVDAMVQVVTEKKVNKLRRNMIISDVKKYHYHFGKTAFATTYKPVLDAMKSTRSGDSKSPYKPGLVGRYYRSHDKNGHPEIRIDANIDFDWGSESFTPGGPKDRFRVVWEGFIKAPKTGDYVLYTQVDDVVTVTVDNKRLLHGRDPSGPVKLKGGVYTPIKITYVEHSGGARMRLQWSSVDIKRGPIESRYLFHMPAQHPPNLIPDKRHGVVNHSFSGPRHRCD